MNSSKLKAKDFITVGIFAVLGLYQWITRKSFKKIDKQITRLEKELAQKLEA